MAENSETPTPADDPHDLGAEELHTFPSRSRDKHGRFISTEPTPPATGQHPDYLVTKAKAIGYADEEIAEMSPRLLQRTIFAFHERELAELQRQRDILNNQRQLATAQSRQTAQPEPNPEPDLGLSEDIHPEIKMALVKIWKEKQCENKELRDHLAARDKRDQQLQQQQMVRKIDRAYALLGADYEPVFGKGPAAKMGHDHPNEYERRLLLLNALTNSGVPWQSLTAEDLRDELQAKADALLLPPKADARKDYSGVNGKNRLSGGPTPEEWARASLARPSARDGASEPPSEQKAIRNLERKLEGQARPETVTSDADIRDTLI